MPAARLVIKQFKRSRGSVVLSSPAIAVVDIDDLRLNRRKAESRVRSYLNLRSLRVNSKQSECGQRYAGAPAAVIQHDVDHLRGSGGVCQQPRKEARIGPAAERGL